MFRNGLMLRDFTDHHLHRRVLQQAFRRTALEGYVEAIHRVIDRHVGELGPGPVDIYRFMKRLTLDIAADVFAGASLGAQAQAVNQSFVAMMAASVTPVRMNLPGTPYRRGVEGRRRLDTIFGELVEERRSRTESADLLSRLSHATTESGAPLTADEVVDHMVFLLLAAHDTTTATLAVLLYELARNPDWQQRVVDEVAGLGGAEVTLDNHKTLTDTSNAMNEALRLSPPVPFSPRVTLRDYGDRWLADPRRHRCGRGKPDPAQASDMVDRARSLRPRPVRGRPGRGQAAQPPVRPLRRRGASVHR